MSHEDPDSLVPGSMHVNRAGQKVFITAVKIKAPWADAPRQPVIAIREGSTDAASYEANGQFYPGSLSEVDIVKEHKEPVVYESYVIVWSDGKSDARCTLELAHLAAINGSNQGRLTWKVFKLTGYEECLKNGDSK